MNDTGRTEGLSDIQIAQQAEIKPIGEIADKLGIPQTAVSAYGKTKAKIDLDYLQGLSGREDGKLILVTAITPTPAGEGKTTTSVGLTDGLNRIGAKTMVCLREPSLGPCFGMKGGAAGGGYAQVIPMEDINLHFTGDFHAIGAANNLLAALIDNHIHWGNSKQIDVRRLAWKRVVDMNDRALRDITCALGGPGNGFPRQDGFDITVASEVMAIFCLTTCIEDLKARLKKIVVGYTAQMEPILSEDINGAGAMATLLKDAIAPNLVQTLEHNPAFIHGGPFANIAHGCNSVIATQAALKLADYVVTEAGFGADLGAEKFFNIKCRSAGLRPEVAVLVVSARALKMQGNLSKDKLDTEDLDALRQGASNLRRHIDNVHAFSVPVIVAINTFPTDTEAEIALIKTICQEVNVSAVEATHWKDGGRGAEPLAQEVLDVLHQGQANFTLLYPDEMPLWEKLRTIATRIYGARDIIADKSISEEIQRLQDTGYGHFPVCIAKTQYSFSINPNLTGAPTEHLLSIREVRLAAGAGFVVAVCGDVRTMPGLPRHPSANTIDINNRGEISGLF